MLSAKQAGIAKVGLLSLARRYDSVLFPFDIAHFLQVLPQRGWIVPSLHQEGEDSYVANVPYKANSSVRLDQGNKLIGVKSEGLEELLEHYREMIDAVESLGEFAPNVRIHYDEFRYTGTITGKASPVQAFARFHETHERLRELVTGVDAFLKMPGDAKLGGYALRLAPMGQDANRPDWAEIALSPVNVYGAHRYAFDVIYRRQQPETVEQQAEQIHDMLKALIESLES